MRSFHLSVCHVALAVALLASAPAQARTEEAKADAAPAPTTPAATGMPAPQAGQVVITTTAQKRFENLQIVPLPVQVITPRQLEEQGVRTFQELGKVAPSLMIRPAEQPASANVSIRGVGTFAFGIGVESSVAVTVDGAAVAFMPRVFADLPDVAQIEVLRGPQSTLYGKAASTGLIKIMTVQPTDDFHIKANVLATTDREYGGAVSVTGPISETLGYVVSLGYANWAGNVTNLVTGKLANGRNTFNSRAKLRWKATPDLTFTLSGNYLDGGTTVGRPFISMAAATKLRGTAGQTPNVTLPGVTIDADNQDVSNNYQGVTKFWGAGTLLRTDINIGKLQILSLTSYDRFQMRDSYDHDDTSAPVALGTNVTSGQFKSRLFTEELRLLSPGDAAFRYAFGLYFANVGFERPFTRGPAFSVQNWNATSGSRQVAAFGQLDWEFLSHVTATVGGRVQNERVKYTFRDNNALTSYADKASDSVTTYRLGLSYQATPDIMAFGSYTTGYKGQTYDLTSGFNAARAAAGPVKPETSKDRELGVRTQFFNRRMTFNLTLFDTDYTNLQAQSLSSLNGVSTLRLTNVGGLNTKGVEIETAANLGHDVSFNAAAAYVDAKYTSFPGASCYTSQTVALGCIAAGGTSSQDLTGTRAVQAPRWKGSASVTYAPSLGGTLKGVAQASWQYQSSLYFAAGDPGTFQPAFSLFNISLGVRDTKHGWQATTFINNLFDKRYYASVVNYGNNFGNALVEQAQLPRDYRRYGGVRFGLSL